jgi:hypothetical protein
MSKILADRLNRRAMAPAGYVSPLKRGHIVTMDAHIVTMDAHIGAMDVSLQPMDTHIGPMDAAL